MYSIFLSPKMQKNFLPPKMAKKFNFPPKMAMMKISASFPMGWTPQIKYNILLLVSKSLLGLAPNSSQTSCENLYLVNMSLPFALYRSFPLLLGLSWLYAG